MPFPNFSRAGRAEPNVMITLNGERREVPEGLTVAGLLRHLGVKPEHVAVEVNRVLVTRARHSETPVVPGDELEVVTLVGGGAPAAAGTVGPLTIGTHKIK